MSIAKSKLLMMIELMQEDDAENLLKYMLANYSLPKNISWDTIEEVEPDEWDLAMLKQIEEEPDDHQPFMTQAQLIAELGL